MVDEADADWLGPAKMLESGVGVVLFSLRLAKNPEAVVLEELFIVVVETLVDEVSVVSGD